MLCSYVLILPVTTHQRLLVLHQPNNLHRLLLDFILKVIRQRRQDWVKVLLGHGVVHRENGLMGQKTDKLVGHIQSGSDVYQNLLTASDMSSLMLGRNKSLSLHGVTLCSFMLVCLCCRPNLTWVIYLAHFLRHWQFHFASQSWCST